ncbi:dimethylaniline monooxygenase (N-oxide forming) [Podospora appendiculata]|uniref:Dimethylaniline monooxygenase (N-oxide forming) n=1 Tax=Podospora appendiculata TaxID=314037 RepID=A0AAE1CCY8_9PEZI|nr:dimethylaniline monooxygenase (N-oxide forming) [Podospora appendiculata]
MTSTDDSESSQRIEPGSARLPPAPWPASATDVSVDANATAARIITSLNQALSAKNYRAVADLFVEDGFWRDHLAVSWDLRTLQGRAKIQSFLETKCNLTSVEIDSSTNLRKPQVASFSPIEDVKGIYFFITVATSHGSGRGVVHLVQQPDNNEWKFWTIFTVLDEVNGHEEPLGPRRSKGVQHGGLPGRKNWLAKRQHETEFIDSEPAVLIIGAGQAGLTAAARLKMLNIPTLIIDRHPTVGDSWRKRYDQLVLHDPVWYDHLPYLDFPLWWPVFTPKDKIADWFESYAKLLELDVWMSSELTSSAYDTTTNNWTVTITRTNTNTTRTLHPRHIIQATGHSGPKNLPSIPGMATFTGSTLCHSSDFPGAQALPPNTTTTTKSAIVVGACNSAHDICQDYHEHGYSVTMIQRSSTCVLTSAAALKLVVGPLYSESGPPVEDADLLVWGWPTRILKTVQADLTKLQVAHDAVLLSGLEKAGFKLDRGVDDGGIFTKYLQRGGGYYIDVGTSQLIVDGKIKVKQGVEITEVLPRGVKFADGTELEADEIVFATGYANMRTQARMIFGDAVADRVGDVWGYDEEGEMRTIWTKSGHPGLWFHGGNLALCRYYSRVLALQILADLKGLDK